MEVMFQVWGVFLLFSFLFFFLSRMFNARLSCLLCSSHRSIFSRESMPPPSDLATHWPISGQSALIPSTSQELFLLAVFGSLDSQRAPGYQWRKISLTSSPTDISHGRSSLKMKLLQATHTKEPALRFVTRATCYSDTPPTNSRTNILSGDLQKNLFSLWRKFTSAMRINLSLLCFKEVSLFILYY